MRRIILYLLAFGVVAFYASVAGAAAAPYYTALGGFLQSATARQLSAPTASPTPTGSIRVKGATVHAPTPTVAPRLPAPREATPTGTSVSRRAQTSPRATTASAPRATAVRLPRPLLRVRRARKPAPTATPGARTLSPRQLAAEVQHIASSSKPPRHRINILVLGSDNDQKFASYAHPLTQVMIVLSIDPLSHTLTLLSIPRDFWVRIPGYAYNVGPNGTVGWSKIDVASKLGFDSAACTVEYNFGIPIDHWVWVGLGGFINAINTMDGVTIDVTHPVIDDNYPDDLSGNPYAYRRIYIPPGPQHANGDTALHFVRSRHGDATGDFGRSDRQQILLTQLRRALEQQDGAGLVALIPSLLNDVRGEIRIDPTLNTDLPTVAYYYSLLRSVQHAPITHVVLSPPYSIPNDYVIDNDPQVDATNGGQPVQENAVAPNWQLIDGELVRLFGGQSPSRPHCARVPGALAVP